jgi:hypothetical protein
MRFFVHKYMRFYEQKSRQGCQKYLYTNLYTIYVLKVYILKTLINS